jgi:hypothetical protein
MKTCSFLLLFLSGVTMAQSAGTFTTAGNLITARDYHTATLLPNGKVLIVGGSNWSTPFFPDAASRVFASAELYDPSTGAFAMAGNMTVARAGHTATLLPNGTVLITGGFTGFIGGLSTTASAEIYDPESGAFFSTVGAMTMPRAFHRATLLNDGRVLIAGPSTALEIYDPSTGLFTAGATIIAPPGGYSAISSFLSNGKVLIQEAPPNVPGGRFNEVYDSDLGTLSLTGVSAYPNLWPGTASALLPNGKLFSTGLTDDSDNASNVAELYDPATGTFNATENMTALRRNPTATLLPDGTVLIAGGGDSSAWSYPDPGAPEQPGSADIYDPSTVNFSRTGSMAVKREGHTATLLPDGTVLVVGGFDYVHGTRGSAELFHPAKSIPPPILLTLSGDGYGSGAVLHASTQQIVSQSNPAVEGEYLEVYLTGLIDGSVIPPQAIIGGRIAEVLFFGAAPGYPGLNQVNVRVPRGVEPDSAGSLARPTVGVTLIYLGRPSNHVTIPVAVKF